MYIDNFVGEEAMAFIDSKDKKRFFGVCLGASSVSAVILKSLSRDNGDALKIEFTQNISHNGDPKKTFLDFLEKNRINASDKIAVTGRGFRRLISLTTISEPEAVELAYSYVRKDGVDCHAIVSAGGETFMVYALDENGKIKEIITGNKCASGTGEFFLQQLRRMNVSLAEAAQWSVTEEPYPVSGRCSVFCKSDCTHAINKGVPKARVTAGLCRMMADKVLELLKNIPKKNLMLVGGSSKNRMMVNFLSEKIDGLIVPKEAPYFEALGAALYAFENNTKPYHKDGLSFSGNKKRFDLLPPLSDFKGRVEFKTMTRGKATAGDTCILGLDVGSTTTKAVLMRTRDNAILASVYLYTDGDPVSASKRCYTRIRDSLEFPVDVIGLGVCGSGRHIAGLHALTDGVINEIIAHAAAAVHFDPEVDTIFEIGGQDAKYTYITAGVPSDYAMNEACSAGTGSFLAESAFETLGIPVDKIAKRAITATAPPNFNDQCAAFIASDIKTAVHEGISTEDVLAGLVYSICMNYLNRVKGNRPVGNKVFMQGGVCYNKAVPLAMAALLGKPIIVPPEPGLMGAYGAALEIKKRISMGLMEEKKFDLDLLIKRDVRYAGKFTCKGGKERCDRKCTISIIELDNKRFPFGGACNRYENIRRNKKIDMSGFDLVRTRERMVFPDMEQHHNSNGDKAIGINKSFLVNTYYPFYSTFFERLGYRCVLPEEYDMHGIERKNAPFCFPAELSHGFFSSLLQKSEELSALFIPHVKGIPVPKGYHIAQVCPFVQGEPYVLKSAFNQEISRLERNGIKVLTPFIDMTGNLRAAWPSMKETALRLGFGARAARKAFDAAVESQEKWFKKMQETGRNILKKIELNDDSFGVVIFGRPYNAFVEEAHMGIPHKLASRGIPAVPYDMLPFTGEPVKEHMYWAMGQLILKAARYVQRHPRLFGLYITNFSCGPDSFLLTYFRDIMGRKPSLTLELDSHTADAGIETRIDAFIDIIREYMELLKKKNISPVARKHEQARVVFNNKNAPRIVSSSGKTYHLTDDRITFLFPSMGRLSTELMAAVFRSGGFNAVAPQPPDEEVLKLGRGHTTCKECLPLILTAGTLLKYIKDYKRNDEILVYFMAGASGPCRFGQYSVFLKDLIKRLDLPDVAVFSLTSDNSYQGLEKYINYEKAWWSILVSDIFEDLRSVILAGAVNPEKAMDAFEMEWENIVNVMEEGTVKDLEDTLRKAASSISAIPLKYPVEKIPKILLTGEIYVRRDGLSRQYITERLAKEGFAVICSPVAEWVKYSDWTLDIDGFWAKMSFSEKMRFYIRKWMMGRVEKSIYSIFSDSGLFFHKLPRIRNVVKYGERYISPRLSGEAILTVGSSMKEIAESVCGVIAIGPFGCMPNRLAESILTITMNSKEKHKLTAQNGFPSHKFGTDESFPFLAVESDGSPFPQLLEAKLEAFCMRAARLHEKMHA